MSLQISLVIEVQPGHSTTLHCFTPDDGHFKVFWLKLQNSSAPVLVALAESDKTGIMIGEKFQDPSKYRLTWNQLCFSLSVLNIEQTDIAVYFCGIFLCIYLFLANGTRLMFEESFRLITHCIQAHPGQSVTMWCSHNIHVSGDLYWFKQIDGAVPITIVHMLYTESLQKVEPNYFNNFTKDRMVMDQSSKSTALTIKQVKMSDSGFYFCGATGYHMKFGNGTKLQVKGNHFCTSFIILSRSYHMYSSLFHFVINSACRKNTTLVTLEKIKLNHKFEVNIKNGFEMMTF
uniref:Ig-like domain-containing protein n=1 Tax=Sinocyclocheilus grahami TaxID=75366 RepID=A0A672QTM9_SINGR